MSGEINIKSTTIERGLELAKDFLGKLIGPSIDELGLLGGDNIRMWRFKNQIRLFNNVEEYCLKKGIEPKKIPLKILLPLVEQSSLEENSDLIKMWESLLINYVDSSKNFSSVVYPKMLSEINTDEVKFLISFYELQFERGYRNHGINVPLSIERRLVFDNKGLSEISKMELDNLIRLGIFKESPISEYKRKRYERSMMDYGKTVDISMTELGIEFIEVCSLKNKE